ncbi:MAG: 3-isopropylmalate dehydratase small subunit [Trueperaceae bacterium]|nr:MAG: 3-isopropylmalate dehydratase small subunit [Trueperaceae bacterium]
MKTENPIRGRSHVYGDDIDTDRIIPGKYTKTLELSQLAEHVLEDLDPEFRARVEVGDILVAGHNFGCGSSREQAPLALKAAGVGAVVAKSFARIFYRNAINIGLPAVEVPEHDIGTGAILNVRLTDGVVIDERSGKRFRATKMPEVMVDILQAGGLANYLKERGGYGPFSTEQNRTP